MKKNSCFIFDKNFLPQSMAAIKSLIMNNSSMEMDIYALTIGLGEKEKGKLRGLSDSMHHIIALDVTKSIDRFWGIDTMGWNYATYVRLLLGEILPKEVDRVLYLDGDIIVTGSLADVFDTDLSGSLGAAVLDKYISARDKAKLHLSQNDPYFNAGVLYINLAKWREENLGERCIKFLWDNPAANQYPDQNALNVMMKGRYSLLPLSFNADGYTLLLPYRYAKELITQPIEPWYSAADYEQARKRPAIVHFIGWYLDKPWIDGNLQPYADRFFYYAGMAGIRVHQVKRKRYAGAIKGRLKEYAREGIKKSIAAGDMAGVARHYKNCEAILGLGSRAKKFLKVGKK